MSFMVNGIEVETPLRIKPCRVGKHSIKVEILPKKKPVRIVSMRTAMFSGGSPLNAVFADDVRVHRLMHEKNGCWTSDHPEEMYSQGKCFADASGDVLVGGLGIGMAASIIANMPAVKSVTVVEIEPEIIALMKGRLPKTRAPIEIVKADLFAYLKRCKRFDFHYYDIWAPTGEATWMSEVVPLRRLVFKRFGESIVRCWQEEEMAGQIRHSISSAPLFKKLIARNGGGDQTFLDWKQHFKPQGVFFTVADTVNWRAHGELLDLYLGGVGTERWEKVFGEAWDHWKKSGNVSRGEVSETSY